jgi:hypothetical protein
MKALTINQPWAEMICRGLKRVENRTWPTNYRGPLAIHVGKSLAWLKAQDDCTWPAQYGVELPQAAEMAFGAIVAVVELVDCVPIDRLPLELQTAWAEGPWCWVLKDARRLEKPIICKGSLQLWKPPDQITPKLLAASGLEGPTN